MKNIEIIIEKVNALAAALAVLEYKDDILGK